MATGLTIEVGITSGPETGITFPDYVKHLQKENAEPSSHGQRMKSFYGGPQRIPSLLSCRAFLREMKRGENQVIFGSRIALPGEYLCHNQPWAYQRGVARAGF